MPDSEPMTQFINEYAKAVENLGNAAIAWFNRPEVQELARTLATISDQMPQREDKRLVQARMWRRNLTRRYNKSQTNVMIDIEAK